MANYKTQGRITSKGAALSGVTVKVFEQDSFGPFYNAKELGRADTDAEGFYQVEYQPEAYSGSIDEDKVEVSPGSWSWNRGYTPPKYEPGKPDIFIKVYDAAGKELAVAPLKQDVTEDVLTIDLNVGALPALNRRTQGIITIRGEPAVGMRVRVYNQYPSFSSFITASN